MKGITLLAIGSQAYGKFAVNMALSIKHFNKELPIQLIYEDIAIAGLDTGLFDIKTKINPEDCRTNGVLKPGKAKLSLYKYLAFDETVYLDVDGILVKDIAGIFEEVTSDFHAQVVRSYDKSCDKWACLWMPLDNVKANYSLPEDYELYEMNTSFMYIKKSKKSERYFKQALKNYNKKIDKKDFGHSWGNDYPDELAFNIATAQTGMNPQLKGENKSGYPVYLRGRFEKAKSNDKNYPDSVQWIAENYYLIGLYGGKNYNHFALESDSGLYNKMASLYWKGLGKQNPYKIANLMKYKYVQVKK